MTDRSHPFSEKPLEARQVRILDPILANQIAAGEVVERPASAIKELLENALDAGSTEITVEIREGGRALMRVSDNGHGMEKDDALLALERHATSKISEVNDLNEIMTLGFRGEALPSIASVSRLKLLTKTSQASTATLIQVEGGRAPQTSEGAGRIGTEVRVEDLFFNVPARRKFLKSAQTESGIIHESVQRLALAYPNVAFKLIKDSHVSLELPQHSSSLERIRALFGSRVADHLCPVAWTGPVRLNGFVSHPNFHFSAHRHAYTFINGRFVKDRLFLSAIQRAFGQKLPRGRYPFYLLHLDIHPSLVDVNVHPAKTQVRFVNEEALLDVLTRAFRAAMNGMNFEDPNRSWRERVVDHSVLQSDLELAESSSESLKTDHSPLNTDLQRPPNSSSGETQSVAPSVDQNLDAHRERIQERLRRRLRGEEIDLDSLATSTRVEEVRNIPSSEKGIDLINEMTEALNKRSDRVVKQKPRHEVTRVTQDELEAWRKSGVSPALPQSEEIKDQPGELDSKQELSDKARLSFTHSPPSYESSEEGLKRVQGMSQTLNELMNGLPPEEERRPALPPLSSLHELVARRSLRAVGRADEWWIQEASDGLVLIHLPTARVHALTDRPVSMAVKAPAQVNLSAIESKESERHTEILQSLGVTLEPFGGQSYRLSTLPKGLESDQVSRVISALKDALGARSDQFKLAWSRSLLSLPLTAEGRAFTLQWLNESGAPDSELPPFTVTLTTQELLRRCEHLTPF